jgi:serine/threonine-protein kinase
MVSPLARKECLFAVGHVLHETYRIERLIGQGGMASVFEVSHVRLPKRFALKVITAPAAQSSEFMLRFRREAEILGALEHPNVVNVVDFNMTPAGQPYLVMELLTGEDLSALLQRAGALPPKVALSIFAQAVAALEVAHAHGITHRDLKPANIFLCSNGVVPYYTKVLDFGIAKSAQAKSSLVTDHLVLMGTPAYMAPEQARGNLAGVDARSDQFSLALVLYEMLAGKAAFYRPGEPAMNTICRIIVDDPPPLADPAMNAAVMRALRKQPEERYPSLSEMAAEVMKASALPPEMILVPERTEKVRVVPPPSPVSTSAESSVPAQGAGASKVAPLATTGTAPVAPLPPVLSSLPSLPPVPLLPMPQLLGEVTQDSSVSPAVHVAPPSLLSSKSGQLQKVHPVPRVPVRRLVGAGVATVVLLGLVWTGWPSSSTSGQNPVVVVDLGALVPDLQPSDLRPDGAVSFVPPSPRPVPAPPAPPPPAPPPPRRVRFDVQVLSTDGKSKFAAHVKYCIRTGLGPVELKKYLRVPMSLEVARDGYLRFLCGKAPADRSLRIEQCLTGLGTSVPKRIDIRIEETVIP